MKSIISGAVMATAIVACLTLNVQAKSFNHVSTVAVSDTGKMKMSKMRMGKMKKDSMKMAKGKMKMGKMKMKKDTTSKM